MEDEQIGCGCGLLFVLSLILVAMWELVLFLVLFGAVLYIVSKIPVGIKYRRFISFSLIALGFELSSLVLLCSLQVRVPGILRYCGLYDTVSSYCKSLNYDNGESYVKFASLEYSKYNMDEWNVVKVSEDDSKHLYHDFYVGMSKQAFIVKNHGEQRTISYNETTAKKQFELCNDVFFECTGLFYQNKLGGIVLAQSGSKSGVYVSDDKYYASNKANNTESDIEEDYSYENEYSMERERLNETTKSRINSINFEYAPISCDSVLQDWQISKMLDDDYSYDNKRQELKNYWNVSTKVYTSIKKNLVQKYGQPSHIVKNHYRNISFWVLSNNKTIILDSFLRVVPRGFSYFDITNATRLFIYNTSIINDYLNDLKSSETAKAKKRIQEIKSVIADRDSELKRIRQAEKNAEEEYLQEQRRERNEKNKVQTDF